MNAATDLDAALDRVEEAIVIDPIIPTASNKPMLAQVKKAEARAIGWYHAWVAQEVTEMGVATWQTLRLLRGRLESLERSVGLATRAHEEGSHIAPERDDSIWAGIVIGALRGVTGRVAVGEAGRGDLVAALTDAEIDAYGVEPRVDLADAAIGRGLEIRLDNVFGHLRSVTPGDLEAIVLRACVEQLPTGEILSLVDLVASDSPREAGWWCAPSRPGRGAASGPRSKPTSRSDARCTGLRGDRSSNGTASSTSRCNRRAERHSIRSPTRIPTRPCSTTISLASRACCSDPDAFTVTGTRAPS